MKTLYIECSMGAAGDMLAAALMQLLPEPERFAERLNSLGIPAVRYALEPSEKCGIRGAHLSVTVDGKEEDEYLHAHNHHEHAHEHEHGHHHDHEHHHHSGLHEIEHILHHSALSERTAASVLGVYKIIAEAESAVHGVPVELVHFHEVGALDAVADIAAVCLLMEEISPERVVVSPINTGFGHVRCAHGILPVPAPATAKILEGIPSYSGRIEGELCTPTGAALIRHFAGEFGNMPVMTVQKIGCGMGKKDFEAANCVRAMLGETEGTSDSVAELSCNIDDMTAEEIGFACERLYDAGALEVFTTPCTMKKSRPGTVLTVLCTPSDKNKLAAAIFKYTETLGIRECIKQRYTLSRRAEELEFGSEKLSRKVSEGFGISRKKIEYDDAARVARELDISLRDARKRAEEEQK